MHSMSTRLAALVLVPVVFSSCDGSEEAAKAKKETGEAVEAISDLASKKKREMMESLRDSMKQYDEEIARLRQRAEEKGGELSEDAKELLAQLEEKAKAARDSLSKLNENKGEVWDSLKGGSERAIEELKKALAEAREKIK